LNREVIDEIHEKGIINYTLDGEQKYRKQINIPGNKELTKSEDGESFYIYTVNSLVKVRISDGKEIWRCNDIIDKKVWKYGIYDVIESDSLIYLGIRDIQEWKWVKTKIIRVKRETGEYLDEVYNGNERVVMYEKNDKIYTINYSKKKIEISRKVIIL